MLSDDQLDHILERLAERQKKPGLAIEFGMPQRDKDWLLRTSVGRAIGLGVLVAVALAGFIWTINNRTTTIEINAQYTHDTVIEVKHDVAETRKEVIDVKREVGDVKRDIQTLSSRLATTRRGFMTPSAPETEEKK
jgi:hypothetical protein